jgi:predicted small secreted protein
MQKARKAIFLSFKQPIQGYYTMFINFRFFTLLTLAVLSFGLSACETVQGVGRDIENTGEVVQNSAD